MDYQGWGLTNGSMVKLHNVNASGTSVNHQDASLTGYIFGKEEAHDCLSGSPLAIAQTYNTQFYVPLGVAPLYPIPGTGLFTGNYFMTMVPFHDAEPTFNARGNDLTFTPQTHNISNQIEDYHFDSGIATANCEVDDFYDFHVTQCQDQCWWVRGYKLEGAHYQYSPDNDGVVCSGLMDYQWNPPYDTMNLNGDWEMENSNVPHITSWLNEQEGELDKFGLSIGNIGALLTYGTATFLANSTTTEGQASVLLNNQDFMSGSIGTTVQLERIKIKIEGIA